MTGRAAQVFEVVESQADSRHIQKVWATHSPAETSFIAVAETNWQIVVSTYLGETGVVLQGPNDRARITPIPAEAEFFGIVLRLGTFMPATPLAHLIGVADARPNATSRTFWLGGSRWEIPTPENADVFVDRLVRQDILTEDRYVMRSLRDEDAAVSLRTMQRRVRRATGMTQTTIRQIGRAHEAVEALGNGAPVADVASGLGYADQAHLTRSLRRFVGQTPAQVLNTGCHWSASSAIRSPVALVQDGGSPGS
jgi:AraC-like DNA-binding protein